MVDVLSNFVAAVAEVYSKTSFYQILAVYNEPGQTYKIDN